MALVVETGAGLEDAESYISVAQLDAYAASRGWDLSDKSEGEKEIALRAATQWIDSWKRFKAMRLNAAQALEFPRTGLADWSGYDVVGVPKRVKDATAELAYRSATGIVLAPDHGRDTFVTKEQVGPLSVSYSDNAPQSTVFSLVERLIGQYTREVDPTPPTPFSGTTGTDGVFDAGMMANPGDGDGTV